MASDTESLAESSGPTEEPLTRGHRGLVGAGASATALTVYQVAVHTGDVPSAGTDAGVWLWFDGTLGRSGWLRLDNEGDDLERGRTDYFYFNLPDLGPLNAAWIWFSRSGSGPGWFLDTVVVNSKTFSYYNWIERTGTYNLTST